MSGLLLRVSSGPITLTAATGRTFLLIKTHASYSAKIKGINVSFNGITAVDPPVLVNLCRYAGLGTAAPLTDAVTPTKNDVNDARTINTLAYVCNAPAGVKTATDQLSATLYSMYVHPQGGWQWSFASDQEIAVAVSGFFGLEITPGTLTATTKVECNIEFEEDNL